jgi:hypothetical protein
MIERLILARPPLDRDRLIPFLAVGKFGIDVEHDAAERKEPVADDLADREFGGTGLAHGRI